MAADKRIEWIWTQYGPGNSAVTGYQIIKVKKPEEGSSEKKPKT